MGVSPAIFESAGQRSEHYVPGVYGRSFNVSSPSGISAGNLCILGKSNGGEPYKMLEFGSLADAKQALVGGELLDAIAYAFSGSSTYVPSKVFAMRVNDGTQSSVTLQSGATDLLTLKSWDWGVHTNQLKILIANGTIANSKKITLSYKDKTEEIDNIVNAALEVNYLGDGVSPTVSVGTDNISFGAMTDVEAPDEPEPVDTLTVSFADFDTLDALVAYVNEGGAWGLSVVGNNDNMKSVKLDTTTNTAVAETGTILYANFDAFLTAISSMELIGDVVILTETTRQVPDNTDAYVYFTGGTVGSYTVDQWTAALTALELEDVQIIATPSTDSGVHALISTHCSDMSNVINRKERTCILGGAIGMSDDAAIAEAVGLNNKLVSFCCDNPIKVNILTVSFNPSGLHNTVIIKEVISLVYCFPALNKSSVTLNEYPVIVLPVLVPLRPVLYSICLSPLNCSFRICHVTLSHNNCCLSYYLVLSIITLDSICGNELTLIGFNRIN